jgi:RND family efflux transporter MFP subunit
MQSPQDKYTVPSDVEADSNGDGTPHDESWAHVPTHYSPRTGTIVTIAVLVLAALLLVAFFMVQHHRSAAQQALDSETAQAATAPVVVDVVHVKYSPAKQPLALPGNSAAWYQSTIYARVSGYVGKWFVDIGDKVQKGETLATIETPDLDAQLAAAQAKLKAAEAQANVEEANGVFAKSTYARWKESPKGVVSEQEREEKRAEYESSLAKEAAAKAQVNLAQAEVDNLQALTAFKKVCAPYAGVITSRRIDIGDLVTAGSTASTTSLFTLAQSDPIRILVDVPQSVSDQTTVGMPATVTVGQLPDRKFEGKVTRTANSIDPVSRTLRVEVDVPNPDLLLVPGMYVDVRFVLATRPLLQVPSSALLFRSEGAQVAVVDPDSTVHFHDVTIARDEGDFVELGSGVKSGDKVALNLSSQVTDGAKVSPIDVDKPAATVAAK